MVNMPEQTKEELSTKINEILGTTIDFGRLSKDDLTTLQEALVKLREANEFPLPLLDRPIGDILEKKIGDKSLRESTLRDLLGLPKGRKGLFGFGILRFLQEKGEENESKT